MFVLGISSYYLLKGRDVPFARRSFAIAAAFGMASILSVLVLGDESGYEIGDLQKVKLAAIEAEWNTEEAPAAFTVIGLPNQEEMRTDYAIKIPYVMGIIATRSLDKQVTGLKDLVTEHEQRIRNGMTAYGLLDKLQAGDKSEETIKQFNQVKDDLGYGLLLKRYTEKVTDATDEQIKLAAKDSIPEVAPVFFAFRIMVGAGVLMLLLIGIAFYDSARHRIGERKWHLRALLWGIPLPWIAIESGWFVAEYGRQPWTIAEVLPTHLSASTLTEGDLWFSLLGICAFYTVLLVVEMYLMQRFARQGPGSLGTGRYANEAHA
jgi:cytochrome d ubiquinol oxidase subunit I